jgi:replicative DNA helicase
VTDPRIEGPRIPPHNADAERAVLGSILLSPHAHAEVAGWLTEEDFYLNSHRLIYAHIGEMIERGQAVDVLTVADELEQNGKAEDVGGAVYLLELRERTASPANVVAYAEIVREKANLRRLIEVGFQMQSNAWEVGNASADIVAKATHALAQFGGGGTQGPQTVKVAAKKLFVSLQQRLQSGHHISGLPTPWRDINEMTLGLQPDDLIIIAGRPQMGKTVMAMQLAGFNALRGGRTLVFSLEMSSEQLVQRQVACVGHVDHEWLRRPDHDDTNWGKVSACVSRIVQSPLMIDDTPALSWPQIAARARREHLRSPLAMVVVDHMHIVRLKGDNPVRELGDVSRGAKALAKEMGIPVVLVAQLNRGPANRQDKRPTMADLRQSGEIEQDADWILLLHRDDYYDDRHDHPRKGLVDVIVGKSRNAPPRPILLRNRMDQMRLEDFDGEIPEYDLPLPAASIGMED